MSLTSSTDVAQLSSSILPVVFLESHVCGHSLSSALGLSLDTTQNINFAVFTRTSGTAIVVGVSSYFAYRVFTRYLSRECIWSIINHTALDPLIDIRHLNEFDESFYPVRHGDNTHQGDAIERCISALRCGTSRAEKSVHPKIAMCRRKIPPNLQRLAREQLRAQCRGIVAFDTQQMATDSMQSSSSIISRTSRFDNEDLESLISQSSNLTSASRIHRSKMSRKSCQRSCSNDSRLTTASTSSQCSASFFLNTTDDFFWDDEFSKDHENESNSEAQVYERSESCALSQLSAMQNLERLFLERLKEEVNVLDDDANSFYPLKPSPQISKTNKTGPPTKCYSSSSLSSFKHVQSAGEFFPGKIYSTCYAKSSNIYYRSAILKRDESEQSELEGSCSTNVFSNSSRVFTRGGRSLNSDGITLKPARSLLSSPQSTRILKAFHGKNSDQNPACDSSPTCHPTSTKLPTPRTHKNNSKHKQNELYEEGLWSLSLDDSTRYTENTNDLTPGASTAMYDSAIVSDFQSNVGDDESVLSKDQREKFEQYRKSGVMRKFELESQILGRISETSSPMKQISNQITSRKRSSSFCSVSNVDTNSNAPSLEWDKF